MMMVLILNIVYMYDSSRVQYHVLFIIILQSLFLDSDLQSMRYMKVTNLSLLKSSSMEI